MYQQVVAPEFSNGTRCEAKSKPISNAEFSELPHYHAGTSADFSSRQQQRARDRTSIC